MCYMTTTDEAPKITSPIERPTASPLIPTSLESVTSITIKPGTSLPELAQGKGLVDLPKEPSDPELTQKVESITSEAPDSATEELTSESESALHETASFLSAIVSEPNQKLIADRLIKLRRVTVNPSVREITSEIGGRVVQDKFTSAGLAGVIKADYQNGVTNFEYAVWLRQGNNGHTVDHEFFHGLTGSLQSEQVNQDVFAMKHGLLRSYQRSADGNLIVAERITDDGWVLNEGLTDYLTYRKDGEDIYDSVYLRETILAQFLTGATLENNDLINAYVSDSVRDIEAFEKKFEVTQKMVKYADLSNKDIVHSNRFKELLGAAIDFRLALGGDNERNFYFDLIIHMETSPRARQVLEMILEEDFLPTMTELKEHIKQKDKSR